MSSKDFLKDLKVGDEVIASGTYGDERIVKVERLTKTQIILDGTNVKYNREHGREIGGSSWCFSHLYEATPERVSAIKEKNLRRTLLYKIGEVKFKEYSTEDLRKVYALIKSIEEKL